MRIGFWGSFKGLLKGFYVRATTSLGRGLRNKNGP